MKEWNKKKQKEPDFVPISQVIGKTLLELKHLKIPQELQGQLIEMTSLYHARGLRIEGKKAIVVADELEEVHIALQENFPLVVRDYGGTTRSKNNRGYPGCIFYVQTPQHAYYLHKFMPYQSIIPKDQKFPHHVTFRGRRWSELIWLAQRFMREHFEQQKR